MPETSIADNLGYYSHAAALRLPDKIALHDLSGAIPRTVSYGEMEARMNRVASLLTGLGLVPGDRFAMCIGNRFEFVEIMYGAMRAGIVPVPLNTKLGADTLAYTVENAGCKAALVDPTCNAFIVGVCDAAGLSVRIALSESPPAGWSAYEPALMQASAAFEPPLIGPDHASFQPYTSGSTGRPKGVVLTHGGQLWWIRACERYWPVPESECALAAVPLYHKNAMAGAIKPMLHAGASVVILPNFEPVRFLNTLSDYRCTRTSAVPAVYTLLLQHRELIDRLDFSALTHLSVGSAPVQKELMHAIEDAFGCGLGESYGLTEGGPVMIGPPLDGRRVPFGSCGVAWPEGEVKLVASDGSTHPGDGELWVRNPGVTPGYFNLPEVNAKRIREGWLATGDLFHCDADGFYYFRGRTDDMFNCGGENIYPKEVEDLLLAHPAVYDASVVPVHHPIKGEVPVALVMLKDGEGADEAALKRWCLDNGPAFAHPRRIAITREMPLNGAGKVDRMEVGRMLRDLFAGAIAQAAG